MNVLCFVTCLSTYIIGLVERPCFPLYKDSKLFTKKFYAIILYPGTRLYRPQRDSKNSGSWYRFAPKILAVGHSTMWKVASVTKGFSEGHIRTKCLSSRNIKYSIN